LHDLNFNIFNIIIISGVIQGIIFSVLVLTQKKNRTNNTFFLGLVVLFLSFSNLQYWLSDTYIILNKPNFSFIFVPWQWLIMPMFYLYVYKFLDNGKITTIIWALLIGPFILAFSVHIYTMISAFLANVPILIPMQIEKGVYLYLDYFSFVFNILVLYFTLHLIIVYEKNDTYNILWVKSETNWLKKLIYVGFLICIFWIFGVVLVTIYPEAKSNVFYPLWIGISFLIYWIGYAGLNKSKALRERIQLRKKRILKFEEASKNLFVPSKTLNKIEDYIQNNKSYLNPYLSLNLLSNELSLSEGYISQVINKSLDQNINDYINSLRVEDAKHMLNSDDYDNYTILSIGLESGFNSKSSFYNAFKKFTGKTPLEFKKSVQNH
jgi:AraC-like DNA-binding protein